MKIRPNIGPDCFTAANLASREKLTKDEINAAFQRVFDYKEKLRASGDITDMADKLRTFAEKEAERTKTALKKHFWNKERQRFARMATPLEDGTYRLDMTSDSAN